MTDMEALVKTRRSKMYHGGHVEDGLALSSNNMAGGTMPGSNPRMAKLKKELEAIRMKNSGLLRQKDVVAYAKVHPKSALYGRFEWDDTVAAEKYRIQQATTIIQEVTYYEQSIAAPTRMYVSLSMDRGQGYRAMQEVLASDAHRNIMLLDARREADTFRKKFRNVQEMSGVIGAIDSALADADVSVA